MRLLIVSTILALAPAALAQEDGAARPAFSAAGSADAGMFMPWTLAPRVDTQTAMVSAVGGYNSAAERGVFEASVEVHLWGPIALRGGTVYSPSNDELRPSVGVRVQALRQEAQGIDGSVGLFYKPEGFTEPESEIEAVIALGRRFGAVGLFGNLVYGQDGEAEERDGEVRVGALYRVSRAFQAGLDGRVRFDLGTEKPGVVEPALDLVVGPTASYAIGPVAVLAQVGVTTVQFDGDLPSQSGVIASAGLGTAF